MYYNWYNPETGAMLTTWPADGSPVYPFLSTVDNGWLATALIVVSNSVPQLRNQALALLNGMNFGFFEDKNNGLLYGGYWPDPRPELQRQRLHLLRFRHAEHRAAHLQLHWHRHGQPAASTLLPHVAHLPRSTAIGAGRKWNRKGVTQTYLGVRRL